MGVPDSLPFEPGFMAFSSTRTLPPIVRDGNECNRGEGVAEPIADG